jgi:hypothetical protein
MRQVRAGPRTPKGARLRLRAVDKACLDFARSEPSLFDTVFTATDQYPPNAVSDQPRPLEHVKAALANLVATGLVDPVRRPNIEYPTWATVHGLGSCSGTRREPEGSASRFGRGFATVQRRDARLRNGSSSESASSGSSPVSAATPSGC